MVVGTKTKIGTKRRRATIKNGTSNRKKKMQMQVGAKNGAKNQSGIKKAARQKKKATMTQVGRRPKTQSGSNLKNGRKQKTMKAQTIKPVHPGAPSRNGRRVQMMAAVMGRVGTPRQARVMMANGGAVIQGKKLIGQQIVGIRVRRLMRKQNGRMKKTGDKKMRGGKKSRIRCSLMTHQISGGKKSHGKRAKSRGTPTQMSGGTKSPHQAGPGRKKSKTQRKVGVGTSTVMPTMANRGCRHRRNQG
mmetsp:Transcript_49808/g.98867  ORF Transcript_49808/g.98867 Transcript_49808/m.98867 type:complete len:246 (-) Transcript_49808:845-1582(-)